MTNKIKKLSAGRQPAGFGLVAVTIYSDFSFLYIISIVASAVTCQSLDSSQSLTSNPATQRLKFLLTAFTIRFLCCFPCSFFWDYCCHLLSSLFRAPAEGIVCNEQQLLVTVQPHASAQQEQELLHRPSALLALRLPLQRSARARSKPCKFTRIRLQPSPLWNLLCQRPKTVRVGAWDICPWYAGMLPPPHISTRSIVLAIPANMKIFTHFIDCLLKYHLYNALFFNAS